MSSEMNDFENFLNELNKVENINFGGCGFAALLIYEFAKIKLGKDPHIIGIFEDVYDYEANIDSFINGEYTPTHFIVLIEDTYYDSNGQFSDVFDECPVEEIPEHLLIKLIKEGDWNTDFDRLEQLPELNRISEKYLGFPYFDDCEYIYIY